MHRLTQHAHFWIVGPDSERIGILNSPYLTLSYLPYFHTALTIQEFHSLPLSLCHYDALK